MFNLRVCIACVNTHKCTYTHTGKPASKSEMIIFYSEKRGARYNMLGQTNKRWYHPYDCCQWEQLTGNIQFASKVHLGVRSNIKVAKGTAISVLSGSHLTIGGQSG